MVVSNIFVIFTPIYLGEMFQFDGHIFQTGWFNHHLYYFFVGLQEMKKLLQLTIKKMQLRPEVRLTKGWVQEGSLNGTPLLEGIKLDANVWQFSEISLIIVHCMGW